MTDHTHHPLYEPFVAAINQAMHGKGVRHGGASVPFLEQPIFHYAKMHGRGFLTGQAAKKLEEAASTRHDQPFLDEILGAMVYLGAAYIDEMRRMQREKELAIAEQPLGAPVPSDVWPFPLSDDRGPRLSPMEHVDPRECMTCKHALLSYDEAPCSGCVHNLNRAAALPIDLWEPRG